MGWHGTARGYTSAATMLSGGSATIKVTPGSLAIGTYLLTATYTPDTTSSSIYISASGTAVVTVTPTKKPTVTVTPSATNITTAQNLSVTVALSGGSGNPTPTGSVTLTGGGYTSPATTLTAGSATINILAGL